MARPGDDAAPAGYHTLNPYMTAKDVPALIDFLQRAFDGMVEEKIEQPDGLIEHAEVRVGDSLLMIGPARVDALVREHAKSRPEAFYVFVPDVDATYERAMACGAHAWALPHQTFHGDRLAAVTDLNGNAWWIATRQLTLDARELQARADRYWHQDSTAVEEPPASEAAHAPCPPPGYRVVNPYVSVGDTNGFIDFVMQTFGGYLVSQIKQPDGRVEHAEIRIGDSVLMVGPPQIDALAQPEDHHRPSTFYVFAPDVDATCDKALACGAALVEPPEERFFGDRVAGVEDPYGNHWWIATRKEALQINELQERAYEHWDARSHALRRTVTRGELLEFLESYRYAVEATVTEQGLPQAALIGFTVNDRLELFFDTFSSTRKARNLARDARVALVIGGNVDDQRTVQYEGTVDLPTGAELEALKSAYFAVHPDGVRRSKLPGIRYFRVRPRWIRYTNFNAAPGQIVAFEGAALDAEGTAPRSAAILSHTQRKGPWQPLIESDPAFNAFVSPAAQDTAPRRPIQTEA